MGVIRITIVSSEFPPCGGGIGNYVRKLASGLTERGHSIHVLTRKCSGVSQKDETNEGYEVTRLPFTPIFPLGNLRIGKSVDRIIRTSKSKPDVVNVHYPAPVIVDCGVPTLLTLHNVVSGYRESVERGGGIPSTVKLATPALRIYEGYCLRKYSRMSAVSEVVANQARKGHAGISQDIEIVGNGVDINRFRPARKEDRGNYLLYAGRLDKSKRINTLFKAFSQVAKDCDNLELWVAGDGPTRRHLGSLADRLEVGRKVRFLGWLSGAEYTRAVSRALIYVLPSESEGMSTTLLEALSCGVASIVCDIPNNRELIEDGVNGKLFTPGDWELLANEVRFLYDNPTVRTEIEGHARSTIVNRYDWSQVLSRFEKLVDTIGNRATKP